VNVSVCQGGVQQRRAPKGCIGFHVLPDGKMAFLSQEGFQVEGGASHPLKPRANAVNPGFLKGEGNLVLAATEQGYVLYDHRDGSLESYSTAASEGAIHGGTFVVRQRGKKGFEHVAYW
jgi:hypothetical protein